MLAIVILSCVIFRPPYRNLMGLNGCLVAGTKGATCFLKHAGALGTYKRPFAAKPIWARGGRRLACMITQTG